MFYGLRLGNFMPLMMLTRILPFIIFIILVILTIVFWVIYGVNKFQWAKITAIVLSSVAGVFFIGSIAMITLKGFMPIGRHMANSLHGLRYGIRRF